MEKTLAQLTAAQEAEHLAGLLRATRSGKFFHCACPCPAHTKGRQNFSFWIDDTKTRGQKIFIKSFSGCDKLEIIRALLKLSDFKHLNGEIENTYPYKSAEGDTLYERVRFLPKGFCFRRSDGNGGYTWTVADTERVLYNLRGILGDNDGGQKSIVYCEGEKDAETLISRGFVATTAGSATSWQGKFAETLASRDVVLCGDIDDEGRKHVEEVARSLHGKAKRLRIVTLPAEFAGKKVKDVSDFFDAGGSVEKFQEMIDSAPDYVPSESPNNSTILEPTPKGNDDGFLKHPLDVAGRIAQLLPGLTFRHGRFFRKSEDGKLLTPVDELSIQRVALKLFDRPKLENSFSVVEATLKCLRASLHRPEEVNGVSVCDLEELLTADLPPRQEILKPWLLTQSINMLYAARGIGKTQVALNLALAVATGDECMRWSAPHPRPVVYVDGEMPAVTLRERLSRFKAASAKEYLTGMLRLVTPDLQKRPMPDLSTAHGQQEITDIIGDAELVILDNLSCLVRGEKSENDAESWLAVQEWMLSQRTQGKAIVFLHHSGKAGTQRGTSKKEDILDCVIALRRPEPYSPDMGCIVVVTFEKSRNLFGHDVEPFQAKLTVEPSTNGSFAPAFVWKCDNAAECLERRIIALKLEGLSQRDIARETRTSQATVSRILKGSKPATRPEKQPA